MSTLRRLVPVFAALLAVVVAVQTTDLVACADEAAAVEHGESRADGPPGGGHPSPAPDDSHDDGHGHDDGTSADCLCHLAFTPTAVAPEVGAQPAPEPFDFAAVVAAIPEVEPEGLDHVPLG